jgi:4-alpha-glucanotransferase
VRAQARLPLGYHRLELRAGRSSLRTTTTVIAAPRHAHLPARSRAWGVFLPLHSVRSEHNCGVGDFADLLTIAHWTSELGGDYLGTLPLLATFLNAPFEPSPYAPVTRLFWSDLFLDLDHLPGGDPARGRSAELKRELETCRAGDLVDYRRIAALKREIAGAAAQRFFSVSGDGKPELRAYLDRRPEARDYARFRAVCDRRRVGWPEWPARLRDGEIRAEDYDVADEQYHLYTTWLAEEQLGRVAADNHAARLYLDLPLGVNQDGYDPWRRRALFALDASAGAPPDPFFPAGQSWGFPPLKPAALRADGYRYIAECLRNHLRYAGALRLDHVMSLQRLFWIPRGLGPDQGVYVRYPLDELCAILTLESVRHEVMIIGEDLGTVSREIRVAMSRHRIQRMFVVQFEAAPDRREPIPPVPRSVVASLNTHDMPTFAAYWRALDLPDRQALGLLSKEQLRIEHDARSKLRARIMRQLRVRQNGAGSEASAEQVILPLLEYLAVSPARILLVNLEDLWLETQPQNVPGTHVERPNWRRRARYDLDRIRGSRQVIEALNRIASLRAHPKDNA